MIDKILKKTTDDDIKKAEYISIIHLLNNPPEYAIKLKKEGYINGVDFLCNYDNYISDKVEKVFKIKRGKL